MDDESIIALYWQRDQRAITETDTKYGALCRTVASGILRDREDTEECVSDAYLAAWNAIPPHTPQRFRAYICTVVRNISVSRVREKCLKRRGGGEYPAALDELDECTAGSGSDPARRVELRELASSIDAFLSGLSPDERKIFMCRYWLVASVAKTAALTGCSEAKVKTSLHRTRKKLQKHLEKEGLL